MTEIILFMMVVLAVVIEINMICYFTASIRGIHKKTPGLLAQDTGAAKRVYLKTTKASISHAGKEING